MAEAQHRITAKAGTLRAWCAVFVLVAGAAPASAVTSLFTNSQAGVCSTTVTCYQAGDFGVLVGLYNAVTPNAWSVATVNYTESGSIGADVNGEIGIGSGSKIVFNNSTATNRTWDGPIDFADSMTNTAGPCAGNACGTAAGTTLQSSGGGKITVNGGTVRDVSSQILTALTQMEAISDYYRYTWPSSHTVTSIASGQLGRSGANGVTGIGTSGGGVQVFSTAQVNSNTGLTITGGANDLIVINVTGNSQSTFGGNITLSGGITSDQVFWNIYGVNGSGNILNLSSGTLAGIFYVGADSYNAATTLNGRLFGGTGTSTWGANFQLNAPADEPWGTPEPSTYVIMGAGLGVIFYIKRRASSNVSA